MLAGRETVQPSVKRNFFGWVPSDALPGVIGRPVGALVGALVAVIGRLKAPSAPPLGVRCSAGRFPWPGRHTRERRGRPRSPSDRC